MATLRAIYERLMAMTGVVPTEGRREPAPAGPPQTRRFRLPFARRPKVERQTQIPPEQQPGGGAPHR